MAEENEAFPDWVRIALRMTPQQRDLLRRAAATKESECSLASLMDNRIVPLKVFAPRSDGCRYQRLEEKSASGEALWGKTLNQPLMPQASAIRPTSMASAGNSAGSNPGTIAGNGLKPPWEPG